jgi:GT2 family glycosyltransferase
MTPTTTRAPQLSVIIATHNNRAVLQKCLECWQRFAADAPVELLVVEDGCTDGTAEYLAQLAGDGWSGPALRVLHEDNVHELMCTNRGFREARAPLIMSWHDDMFLQASWFVPELLRTFGAYPDIGLMSLSRGLLVSAVDAPVLTWEDSVDWRRLQSTIGPAPWNWVRLYEVDAVMRPWVVRRACLDAVGPMDEVFRPTEWDEADLCYRIRQAGWRIATHGYERDGAYRHLLSTTYSQTPSERRQAIGLRNARIFYERWDAMIHAEHGRPHRTWRRLLTLRSATSAVIAAVRHAIHPSSGTGGA